MTIDWKRNHADLAFNGFLMKIEEFRDCPNPKVQILMAMADGLFVESKDEIREKIQSMTENELDSFISDVNVILHKLMEVQEILKKKAVGV